MLNLKHPNKVFEFLFLPLGVREKVKKLVVQLGGIFLYNAARSAGSAAGIATVVILVVGFSNQFNKVVAAIQNDNSFDVEDDIPTVAEMQEKARESYKRDKDDLEALQNSEDKK